MPHFFGPARGSFRPWPCRRLGLVLLLPGLLQVWPLQQKPLQEALSNLEKFEDTMFAAIKKAAAGADTPMTGPWSQVMEQFQKAGSQSGLQATATTAPFRARVSALPAQILSKVTDALSTFAHILSPAPPQFKPPPIDSAAAAASVPGPASLTLTPQLTRKRSSSASAVRCDFGWFVYHCKHVSLASPLFLLSSIRVLIPCVQTINCCVRHALFARTFVLFRFTY